MFDFDYLVERKSVLCGACALARNGMSMQNSELLDLMTPFSEVDGVSTVYVTYYYYECIDFENWVEPSPSNPLILKPTRERALVDYLRNEKWCDEGVLIEALKDYLQWFRNDEELYKVAEFYGVERSTIDYWVNEALTDEEV